MIADKEGTFQCDTMDGSFVRLGIRIGLTVRPHHEPSPADQDHPLMVGRTDNNVSQSLKRCFEGTLEEISAEVCDPGADLDTVFPKMIQGCRGGKNRIRTAGIEHTGDTLPIGIQKREIFGIEAF